MISKQWEQWEHTEKRTKVSLSEFYADRWHQRTGAKINPADALLWSTPAYRPGRAKTRDMVPFSDRTLTRLCKPLTHPPAPEFKAQTVAPYQKLPRYVDWLRSIGAGPVKAPPKPRAKRKPKAPPMFQESKPERWRNFPMEAIPCFLQS
jgi:hypothetical protein